MKRKWEWGNIHGIRNWKGDKEMAMGMGNKNDE